MNINDSRPIPPPKPTYPSSIPNDNQNDYDNMPSIYSSQKRTSTFHNPDISNGPPGYYQSLPQSSYAYMPKDNVSRYSTTAETISNFMNGTFNNADHVPSSFSTVRKYVLHKIISNFI